MYGRSPALAGEGQSPEVELAGLHTSDSYDAGHRQTATRRHPVYALVPHCGAATFDHLAPCTSTARAAPIAGEPVATQQPRLLERTGLVLQRGCPATSAQGSSPAARRWGGSAKMAVRSLAGRRQPCVC